MSRPAVVVTCEHGGARVPARYRALFAGASRVLASHRGFDPGALPLARQVARRLGAPLVATSVTRLLVDTNRSLHHPRLFSGWSRGLERAEREQVVDRYWRGFRDEAAEAVEGGLAAAGRVVHLSVHSFTPRWEGRERRVDVGFLYDPRRARELSLALAFRDALADLEPGWRLARNRPYRGTADGHTTALRASFGPRYAGIELEVSQRLLRGARASSARRSLAEAVATGLGGS